MLDPRNRELLNQLATMQHGKALKAYLDEKYSIIGDITLCTSWEHTVGRQYALSVLKDVFSFLEEKQTVDKIPNQYT